MRTFFRRVKEEWQVFAELLSLVWIFASTVFWPLVFTALALGGLVGLVSLLVYAFSQLL